MLRNKKPGLFSKANTALNLKLETLKALLLDKNYIQAKSMLAADPELYEMKDCELNDVQGFRFPKISLFTYMCWKHDVEGINAFIHGCNEMSAGVQHTILAKLKNALEKFIKSGTVVIIDGVKNKKHHGLVERAGEVNFAELLAQINVRLEALRVRIVSTVSNDLLGNK